LRKNFEKFNSFSPKLLTQRKIKPTTLFLSINKIEEIKKFEKKYFSDLFSK